MDLIGDIVEHEIAAPTAPGPRKGSISEHSADSVDSASSISPFGAHSNGFPTPNKTRPSQWKSRLQKKGLSSMSDSFKSSVKSKRSAAINRSPVMTRANPDPSIPNISLSEGNDVASPSELEKISKQNEETVMNMSKAEIEETKNELLNNMDPKVLQMLMARSQKKAATFSSTTSTAKPKPITADTLVEDIVPVLEGAGTWIGGGRNGETTIALPKSTYSETIDADIDDDGEHSAMSRSSSASSASGLKPALRKNSSSSLSSTSSERKVRFNSEVSVNYAEDNNKKKNSKKNKKPKDSDAWENFEVIEEDAAPNYTEASKLDKEDISESLAKVHFPKPSEDKYELLDINDPKFNEKLHEKYFPDLPVSTEQLEWMKPLDEPPREIVYEAIEELRFDFNGDLITTENAQNINTYEGLHHHSANAEIPGYTLSELAHFARSTFPGQRCIGIRTLGRILHKLSVFHYSVFELDESEEMGTDESAAVKKAQGQKGQFESKVWELVKELRIPETITEAADEKKTKNLSVRNYAIEALWLWKQKEEK